MPASAKHKYVRPSSSERSEYYRGLSLVFRTSTFDWNREGHVGRAQSRFFGTIKEHPVTAAWENASGSLWTAIRKILDPTQVQAAGLQQVIKYVPRGCPEDPSASQRVLLLLCPPKSIVWEQARDICLACRGVLAQHGFNDIEVEMAEGEVRLRGRLNSDPVPDKPEKAYKFKYNTEFVGSAISIQDQDETLRLEGTKGLYLRLRQGTNERTVALTCQHVLAGVPLLETNTGYIWDKSMPKVLVMQPGRRSLRDEGKALSHKVKDQELRIDIRWKHEKEKHLVNCDNEEANARAKAATNPEFDFDLNAERIAIERRRKAGPQPSSHLQERKNKLNVLKAELDFVQEASKRSDKQLAIGHVLRAPSRRVVRWNNYKLMRDWALIALDPSAHTTPLEDLRSEVPAGEDRQHKAQVTVKPAISGLGADYDHYTILPKPEVQEPSELRVPGIEYRFGSVRGSSILGKYGKTTGLTFGSTAGMSFYHRAPGVATHKDEPSQWVQELTVNGKIECLESFDNVRDFSWEGDSGSGVFDVMSGRWVGMLTGGIRPAGLTYLYPGGPDTTFVTPMSFILEDIKKVLKLDEVRIQ